MMERMSDPNTPDAAGNTGEAMTFSPMEMIPASGQYAIFNVSRESPAVEARQLICWTLAEVWMRPFGGSARDCGVGIYGYIVDEGCPALIAAAESPRFIGYVHAANSVIAVRKGYEMLTGEPAPAADALARAQAQTFFTAPEE